MALAAVRETIDGLGVIEFLNTYAAGSAASYPIIVAFVALGCAAVMLTTAAPAQAATTLHQSGIHNYDGSSPAGAISLSDPLVGPTPVYPRCIRTESLQASKRAAPSWKGVGPPQAYRLGLGCYCHRGRPRAGAWDVARRWPSGVGSNQRRGDATRRERLCRNAESAEHESRGRSACRRSAGPRVPPPVPPLTRQEEAGTGWRTGRALQPADPPLIQSGFGRKACAGQGRSSGSCYSLPYWPALIVRATSTPGASCS